MNIPDEMNASMKQVIDREIEAFFKICPIEQNPVLTILRGHLLTEHYLERILQMGLPRGDRLLRETRLSFAHKLHLVEALDVLDDRTIQSLQGLNKVRNLCAHEKDRQLTITDIDTMARPFGDEYIMLRRTHYEDIKLLLHETLSIICRNTMFNVFYLEEVATKRHKGFLSNLEKRM